jgi:Ni/Fe-hydrogenase subunit HybB-like protein
LFAAPFIIFELKVIVWDKVLGLGVTDKIDPMMWGVFNTVIISYFGASAVERVTRIFKR